MPTSYFVCATPRTGSSLLLGLLDSTGVCGHPQAYFREPDEQLWAERWGLADGWTRADYMAAAVRAGSTANGVFGAKLMWGAQERPVHDGGRFIFLRRENVVAQAVSWLRAEQTGRWFVGGNGEISGDGGGGGEPVYDRARIAELVRTIEEHNAGWEGWLAGRDHLRVTYEALVSDMTAVIRGIGRFLGVTGLRLPQPRHHRQADALNDEWISRYQAASIAGS